MAEFLVRAQASSNPKASEIGDIVSVQPDGHTWGNAECLPEYLIVKLPNISFDTIKHFREQLLRELTVDEVNNLSDSEKPHAHNLRKIVKRRKWYVPKNWVEQKAALGEPVTIKVNAQKQAFIDAMLAKTV